MSRSASEDIQDSTSLQADEYGNLWGAGPAHVPQTAAKGELQLALVGAESGATSSATFKVLEPKPWLELTSWSGAPWSSGWLRWRRVDRRRAGDHPHRQRNGAGARCWRGR